MSMKTSFGNKFTNAENGIYDQYLAFPNAAAKGKCRSSTNCISTLLRDI